MESNITYIDDSKWTDSFRFLYMENNDENTARLSALAKAKNRSIMFRVESGVLMVVETGGKIRNGRPLLSGVHGHYRMADSAAIGFVDRQGGVHDLSKDLCSSCPNEISCKSNGGVHGGGMEQLVGGFISIGKGKSVDENLSAECRVASLIVDVRSNGELLMSIDTESDREIKIPFNEFDDALSKGGGIIEMKPRKVLTASDMVKAGFVVETRKSKVCNFRVDIVDNLFEQLDAVTEDELRDPWKRLEARNRIIPNGLGESRIVKKGDMVWVADMYFSPDYIALDGVLASLAGAESALRAIEVGKFRRDECSKCLHSCRSGLIRTDAVGRCAVDIGTAYQDTVEQRLWLSSFMATGIVIEKPRGSLVVYGPDNLDPKAWVDGGMGMKARTKSPPYPWAAIARDRLSPCDTSRVMAMSLESRARAFWFLSEIMAKAERQSGQLWFKTMTGRGRPLRTRNDVLYFELIANGTVVIGSDTKARTMTASGGSARTAHRGEKIVNISPIYRPRYATLYTINSDDKKLADDIAKNFDVPIGSRALDYR